jgi:hypothetical protein
VDIDVLEPSEALTTRPVPQSVAGGLLRIPATVDSRFMGLEGEPQVVACQGVPDADGGLRIGRVRSWGAALAVQIQKPSTLYIDEAGSSPRCPLPPSCLSAASSGWVR